MAPAATPQPTDRPLAHGRLLARRPLARRDPQPTAPGAQPVGFGHRRDGIVYVPVGYAPDRPAPLVVLLHGAGGDARGILPLLQAHADRAGLLLLAPDARRETWDVIRGGFGPDVAYLDAALTATFDRFAVSESRVAVGGFSDGASYALSLGVANGDLFSHVIAFAPGFLAPVAQVGAPRIFVSHGTADSVLPIGRCSRRLVPALDRAGYDVRYAEFEGGHTVPEAVVHDAVEWLLA